MTKTKDKPYIIKDKEKFIIVKQYGKLIKRLVEEWKEKRQKESLFLKVIDKGLEDKSLMKIFLL